MGNKRVFPDWVLMHRQKGMEIHVRGDNYYLSKASSIWDKKLKRARKITGEYLGRITPEGLIPPKYKQIEEMYAQVSVKEFGATHFLKSISGDIIGRLKENYPYEWKELFVLAVFRLIDRSPLMRIGLCYETSYLSETLPDSRTSQGFLGSFIRDIGVKRETMKNFMQSFIAGGDCAAIDITSIFSYSENVVSAAMGHNHDKLYVPQINLLLIYSLDKLQPIYFRQVPGSIRDVSTIISTVNESLIQNIILIGDKGFHSDDNVKELKENHIGYVLSLRRDSRFISYDNITRENRRNLGCFVYGNKHIWFSDYNFEGERIITYLDERLKSEEESDMVMRIKHLEEKESKDRLNEVEKKLLEECNGRLYEKSFRNGTLSVRTSLNDTPEKIFQIMKSRADIEQCFDTFKNTLEADRSYMRDDCQLEGWLFVNFIAMQLYYKIYAILLEKQMLGNHSPADIISHLKRVHMIKAGGKWKLAEIPQKSERIIKKLEIEMPITKNM